MKKKILITTGGSGGHVIPGTVFYEHLKEKFDIFLTIDERGKKFLNPNNYNLIIIDTPKLSGNIFLLPFNLFKIFILLIRSLLLLKKNNIEKIISTGGYMSFPINLAGIILNIKIYLFEPNMILGRANKFFLKYSKKIFCYTNKIKNLSKETDKIILIQPLLRKEFYNTKLNNGNYKNKDINLLIIGGSQGAHLFDVGLKKTIIQLSKKYSIKIYQQVNYQSTEKISKFYYQNDIHHKLFNYETSIVDIIKACNLCITRAGASTLSELTFLNLPYLTVPFALAKDNHQYENAQFYKNNNCCWLLSENDIRNDKLTDFVLNIIENKKDYEEKKLSMKKFTSQNTWNNINQKLINTINEN